MAEIIISSSGPQYGLIVNPDGSIKTAGSIWSMPAVTANAGSESYIKGGSIEVFTGSIHVVNFAAGTGYAGSDVWQGTNPWQVAGSIWSMPAVTANAGSESYIKGGSIHLYSGTSFIDVPNRVAGSIVNMPIVGVSGTNFSEMIGSVRSQNVQITSPWVVSGNVLISGTINIGNQYLGSESWIKAGSVQTYNPLGSTFVLGSIYTTGSVNIVNPFYAGSESWIKAGSIQTYNPLGSTFVLGSVYSTGSINIATSLSSIGSWTGYVGSIWSMPAVTANAGSESWIKGGSIQTYSPLGSTYVMGSVYSTGSINIATNLASIGSWTGYVGSIWSMPSVSVTTGSESWIKGGSIQTYTPLGSTFIMGSVYATGSIFWGGGVGSVVCSGTTQIAGSIWSMPSVSVTAGSEQWIKGGSIQTYNPLGSTFVMGSVYTVGSIWFGGVGSVTISNLPAVGSYTGMSNGSVFWGGGVGSFMLSGNYPGIGSFTGMSNGSLWFGGGVGSVMISGTSQIAGSIWSMPSVSVTAGSEQWIKGGSIEVFTGSISAIQLTDPWQIAGSIWSMPSVSVTAGSESWIKGGSIQTYSPLGSTFVLGSVYVAGSIFFGGVGSVVISNMPAIGSWTGMSNGSIFWGGGVGSVVVSGLLSISGPSAIGSYTGMSNGSIWWGGGVGSVVISGIQGPWSGVGSNYIIQNQLQQIGSFTAMSNGSMWFGGGVGSIMISGTANVNISTGIGSVYITDSNINAWHDVGSPCFKTSYLIASGAWSQTWTIGGAGSRLEIHGWHISTNLPGWVRILVSGTANNAYDSGLVANYFMHFASGGVIEKTFVSPIIPAGAGSAVGFGTTCAGSTNVTIFGREVK